jgi:hypothetical protein
VPGHTCRLTNVWLSTNAVVTAATPMMVTTAGHIRRIRRRHGLPVIGSVTGMAW